LREYIYCGKIGIQEVVNIGKAATTAKNKYNAKAYDRLYPYVHKGKKEVYYAAAQVANISLNEFIEQACDKLACELLAEE